MARWQQLPDSLSPDFRLLVSQLRIIKQQTGLSLEGLAARTAHSKSSWHRYLNGDQFPPRTAIEAIGPLAGADLTRLLTLWDTAFQAETEPKQTEPNQTEPQSPPAIQATAPIGRIPRAKKMTIVLAALGAISVHAAFAEEILTPATARPRQEADTSCRGETCEGHYANRSGCEKDARTESTVADAAYTVRLRYSPSCAAIWAEVQTQAEGTRNVSIASGPNELLAAYAGRSNAGGSSPMLAATKPGPAQACAEVAGRMACTGLP